MALRRLTIEDLVGRRAVSIEITRVAAILKGKTFSIAGAGGYPSGLNYFGKLQDLAPKSWSFWIATKLGCSSLNLR